MRQSARDRILTYALVLGATGMAFRRLSAALHSTDPGDAADIWMDISNILRTAADHTESLINLTIQQGDSRDYTEKDVDFAGKLVFLLQRMANAVHNMTDMSLNEPASMRIQSWTMAKADLDSAAAAAIEISRVVERSDNPMGDSTQTDSTPN